MSEGEAGLSFVMAGGGTGGHIIPALAVAEELKRRGHTPWFIGTRSGMEARLVPAAGFPIEWIEIGGLNRVGLMQKLRTSLQLPWSTARVWMILRGRRPAAVFSMGGYVAGPVVAAAILANVPIVIMEPNAVPGFTNRRIGKLVKRALLNFPQAARFFPDGRAEVTGVPVRREFFDLPKRESDAPFTVLITGGSRGSRTLNQAAQASWPMIASAGLNVRIIHQTGRDMHSEVEAAFRQTGLMGEVVPFLNDMPAAFAVADLVVCRSGASTVSELAAAGKASVLVPFPFAADDHQLRNAEALERAGGARLVLDQDMTGDRLYREIAELIKAPEELATMRTKIRQFAKPNAAISAADALEGSAVR